MNHTGINPRQSAAILAVALVLLSLGGLWHWQPERQVRLHTDNLLTRFSDRKWNRVAPMISDRYADRWGFDKTFVLRESKEVLRQFFALTITPESNYSVITDSKNGEARTTLRIQGSGTAIAEFTMTEINRLNHPFTLRWVRPGWKPWHWELIEVSHPDFQPPSTEF